MSFGSQRISIVSFFCGLADLADFVLDSLRGLDETIQYGQGEKRKEQMSGRSKELALFSF